MKLTTLRNRFQWFLQWFEDNGVHTGCDKFYEFVNFYGKSGILGIGLRGDRMRRVIGASSYFYGA